MGLPKQMVGNIGLYYVCYEMSRRGWYVLPTTRNTRGVDLVAYNEDWSQSITIQVKCLSKAKQAVGFGKEPLKFLADFLIVVEALLNRGSEPSVYIIPKHAIEPLINIDGAGNVWIEHKRWAQPKFQNNWSVLEEKG